MSVCRPTVHPAALAQPGLRLAFLRAHLEARGGRERLVLRARDEPYLWGGRGIGHFEYGRPARAPGRGPGIATVFGGHF